MKLLTADAIPKVLREIPQPPKKLYLLGKLPPEHLIYLTIVGARNHTSYGKNTCMKLIEGLSGYPIVIVSGLALGIDTIVHDTALRAGLSTVAFPGSGLDPSVLYPRNNFALAQKILDAGGAIVSEFEPETKAALWTFPQRNRLMAGISRATLIIEATEKSGTLITARLATEYNRDVMAVPGSIFSEMSAGPHLLLRLGATPITKSEDILQQLGFDVSATDENKSEKLEALADCSAEEKEILGLLSEPTERDEIARSLGKPIHEINTTLSIMEIKGLIREEFGEIRRA